MLSNCSLRIEFALERQFSFIPNHHHRRSFATIRYVKFHKRRCNRLTAVIPICVLRQDTNMPDICNIEQTTSAEERLHPIALNCIFKAIFPLVEEELLDYALCRGPNSPWSRRLRTKKALMLVSRKWSLSAATFLYRDIVVRRVSSLVTLADILRQDPCRGSMIKALRLDCLVSTSMNEVARDTLCLILDSCPSLRTLDLGRFFIPSFLTNDWPHETKFDGASVDATICAISRRTPLFKSSPSSRTSQTRIISRQYLFSRKLHIWSPLPFQSRSGLKRAQTLCLFLVSRSCRSSSHEVFGRSNVPTYNTW